MSMFFFRLHNLRREEEKKRRRKKASSGQLTRDPSPLTLAPSRLFEKSPVTPSDSLDEIALQIPRFIIFSSVFFRVVLASTYAKFIDRALENLDVGFIIRKLFVLFGFSYAFHLAETFSYLNFGICNEKRIAVNLYVPRYAPDDGAMLTGDSILIAAKYDNEFELIPNYSKII